jgi:hypothetical protein
VLLPELNAYTVGQLLALYEHQVAVQVGWRRNAATFDRNGAVSPFDWEGACFVACLVDRLLRPFGW